MTSTYTALLQLSLSGLIGKGSPVPFLLQILKVSCLFHVLFRKLTVFRLGLWDDPRQEFNISCLNLQLLFHLHDHLFFLSDWLRRYMQLTQCFLELAFHPVDDFLVVVGLSSHDLPYFLKLTPQCTIFIIFLLQLSLNSSDMNFHTFYLTTGILELNDFLTNSLRKWVYFCLHLVFDKRIFSGHPILLLQKILNLLPQNKHFSF